MKLNNGRGWEASKSYSSQNHHHSHGHGHPHHAHPATNQHPSRDPHNAARNNVRPGVTQDRLNAAQPPPPSPGNLNKAQQNKRLSQNLGMQNPQGKRVSGSANGGSAAQGAGAANGGLDAPPAPSTQAQFANSNPRLSTTPAPPQTPPMAAQPQANTSGANHGANPNSRPTGNDAAQNDHELSFFQKIMKALCCG